MRSTESSDGRWQYLVWEDGNEQVYADDAPNAPIFIERVVGPKSRRKRWVIVDRRGLKDGDSTAYPPKLAGPFKNLDVAKVAYLMLVSAG